MRKTNRIRAGDGTDRTETYGYDEQYRLKSVDYGDGGTQSYLFDAMGNRTSKTDSVSGTEGYTFDAANRLLSKGGAAYTNDLNGNTLTGGGRVNSWDGQNRLVKCVSGANTSTYKYGSDGLRRQSTVNGVTTDSVLDNGMLVRERSGGVNKATYFVGARGPEYRRDDSTGAVRWYLYDGLGSSLGEVDPSGNVTSSRKFDVYGAVRGGSNPGGTSKQKFVGALGHTSEDETGLIYMRARYYDPATGRFVSEDPIGHGLNWFVYCSNNPINRVDKDGEVDGACVSIDANVDRSLLAEKVGIAALDRVLNVIFGAVLMLTLATYGVFMAKNKSIQDFEDAMRLGKLDPNDKEIRERFHDEITKRGLNFKQLVQAAKEFAKQLANEKGLDENGGEGGDE